MAVTTFDSNFSFKQEEIARMGGVEVSKMSKEQWAEFQNSPFMKTMVKIDGVCREKTEERDKLRQQTDPEFKPQESDWTAEKSFEFDRAINYYKVLGVPDMAKLEDIKQAYKKLSLIYHPDKSAGMSQKEKDEHNAIFIQIKNAYKVVSDQATRRQYDRDRDRDFAAFETNGWKIKTKPGFDATATLKRMQEEGKAPGQWITLPIQCRLEKFCWGGQKVIKRERQVKDFTDWLTETNTFRLEIPIGAVDGFPVDHKGMGDHHEETQPDNLKFVISSKPHAIVERRSMNLYVKEKVRLRPDEYLRPYISGQAETIRGRHIVFWGRNPFYHATGSGCGDLRVKIHGEGVTKNDSFLQFTASLGAYDTENSMVVRLVHLKTKGEIYIRIPKSATIRDVKAIAYPLLELDPEEDEFEIMRAADGEHTKIPDNRPVGTVRKLEVSGAEWKKVPWSHDKSVKFLETLVSMAQTEAFRKELIHAYRLAKHDEDEAEKMVNELWNDVSEVLPEFGFEAFIGTLEDLLKQSIAKVSSKQEFQVLKEKAEALVIDFDLAEFEKKNPELRNPTGLDIHPVMVERMKSKYKTRPVCDVELSPMFDASVNLTTKPPCTMSFYSNLRQQADTPQGQLRPRPLFAVSISCQAGSKKAGLEEWTAMRSALAPVLRATFFYMIKAARGLLPKSLSASSAFKEEEYKMDEDVVVTCPGDDNWKRQESSGCEDDDDDDDDDDDEDEEDKKKKKKDDDDDDDDEDDDESGGGGGGMFDFDDMDDEDEKQQEKAAKAEKKRLKRAARHAIRKGLQRERQQEERRKAYFEREAAKPPGPGSALPVPWKELGYNSMRKGDFFLAGTYYTKFLEENSNSDVSAHVLSDRAHCYAKVGQFDAALDDAKKALELNGESGTAWSRLAFAACSLGEEHHGEALDAYFKAVQYEPTSENIEAYNLMAERMGVKRTMVAAKEENDKASIALKAEKLGLAIAHYTAALARVSAPGSEEVKDDTADAPQAVEKPAQGQPPKPAQKPGKFKISVAKLPVRGQPSREAVAIRVHLKDQVVQGTPCIDCDGIPWLKVEDGWMMMDATSLGAGILMERVVEKGEDASSILTATICSNRCLAYCHMQNWALAVKDGTQAVEASLFYPKARLRLGTALLGCGQNEQAYLHFTKGLHDVPDDELLKKAQQTCMSLLPLWKSVPSQNRFHNRFDRDASRPPRSTKIYAVSDIFYDAKRNDEWVHSIDDFLFQEDVLIVAGNIADTLGGIYRGLMALKSKFRRVFYTFGNHDLWIHPSEAAKFPDSISKFFGLLDLCDALGVDVFPAAVTEDVFVVPLFSWYNSEFDDADPFPEPEIPFDTHCRWPMDPNDVWKFFLALNKPTLDIPFTGTVLTFSHFLPLKNLPYDAKVPKIQKTMGCAQISDQAKLCKSQLHVFGHSRKRVTTQEEGITYVQHSLGYENEHKDKEPIMCVYNGLNHCSRAVPIVSS